MLGGEAVCFRLLGGGLLGGEAVLLRLLGGSLLGGEAVCFCLLGGSLLSGEAVCFCLLGGGLLGGEAVLLCLLGGGLLGGEAVCFCLFGGCLFGGEAVLLGMFRGEAFLFGGKSPLLGPGGDGGLLGGKALGFLLGVERLQAFDILDGLGHLGRGVLFARFAGVALRQFHGGQEAHGVVRAGGGQSGGGFELRLALGQRLSAGGFLFAQFADDARRVG